MSTFAATTLTLPPAMVATPAEKAQEALNKEEERKLNEVLKYLEEIILNRAMPRYKEIMKIKEVIKEFKYPRSMVHWSPIDDDEDSDTEYD